MEHLQTPSEHPVHHVSAHSPSRSFFEHLPPKTSFWIGFLTAVLSLGTFGFLVMGGCLLSGKCDGIAFAKSETGTIPVKAAPADPSDPTPTAGVPVVTDADHIRGDKNAPVTIIEYSDFQCPFCERFHPTMQKIMTEYSGKVRWVFRHFPLSFHPHAEPAAEAAECAADQGKFWEYGDQLFANQDKLGDAYYLQLADQLKLNKSTFQKCLDSNSKLELIRAQASTGGAAGVNGTPGSFVIGKDGSAEAVRGALPYEQIKPMIDAALAASAK